MILETSKNKWAQNPPKACVFVLQKAIKSQLNIFTIPWSRVLTCWLWRAWRRCTNCTMLKTTLWLLYRMIPCGSYLVFCACCGVMRANFHMRSVITLWTAHFLILTRTIWSQVQWWLLACRAILTHLQQCWQCNTLISSQACPHITSSSDVHVLLRMPVSYAVKHAHRHPLAWILLKIYRLKYPMWNNVVQLPGLWEGRIQTQQFLAMSCHRVVELGFKEEQE